ncbi:hypothetical protein [Brevundimonas sp. NIBR11]|uniref:hypothetical protein n=1 Tax=Brevundimonas sp. NIBR11 TaxID=3015999 RepID=UPI0022F08D6B|nr:hypothetical protein [Brevundimonas sp. NIBR11]
MAHRSSAELEAENAYLRQRVAQLENDVIDLSAQVVRAHQQTERLMGRAASPPNPLSGGQSF